MKKLFFAISFAASVVLHAQSPTAVTSKKDSPAIKEVTTKIPTDPSVKIGKLSNGITYYIQQNSKPENKVELRLAINTGSILEDEDQLGLAHFMEHMNFNGTKNFKKNELVDYLQSIGVKFGAHLNAYTGFDQTVYILPIPSDDEAKLEKGFQIVEDWAHGALLTGKDIDEERGVVLEEYRSRRGADSRMLEKYLPVMMHGSKYADRLPIGTEHNLKNFKHESLRRFYKDWYRPDLMAVIAVGDVDVATLEQKIKAHFEKIPGAKNPKERAVETIKNHKETFIAIESDKEAPFSRVQLLYKDHENTAPETTVNDYRQSIVESLFSQMLNNRLSELRNSENPPFVYGFSYHGGTLARNRNAFQSTAGTSADGQLKGLEALLDENERVKRYGFQEGEFDRAKKNIIARIEKAFKDKDKRESGRIVGSYVDHFLEQSPIPSIEWEFKAHINLLPTIKLEDVNKLINNYLHDDNRVVIITGPKTVVTKEQVINALNNVKNKELKPYEDKVVATSLMEKTPAPGSIVSTTTNKELGSTTFTLSNGAKVTYKKTDFKNDEILFDAFSYGGTSLYSDDDLKATAFANGALNEAGINGYSKNDLSKMLSGKLVNVRPFIGSLSEGFRGSVAPKYLEDLFQMVHLYFTSLNKDEKAFTSYVNKQKSFLGNLLASPNFFYQKEMGDFMNKGNNRYVGFPSPEAFDKADYNLAYKKYQERFADAGDFNFYFVGNIDENKLKEFCTTYLASLPGKNSKESYKVDDFRPLSGSHTKTVEKGKDPKSSVQIIYQGPAKYDDKEALAFSSLGEIVSIKLIEKLREQEGGVYSSRTRGNISKMPYGWYNFTISFPCAPENVDKLTTISVNQVADIVKNGPTEEDLSKTKKALIADYKEDLKKNNFWLSTLKNIDYAGDNPADVFTFEETVNALTKKDIQTVAKKYLTNGYILGVLNPEK